MFQIVPRTNQY